MSCGECRCKDTTGLGYCRLHIKANLNSDSIQAKLSILEPFNVRPIDNGLYIGTNNIVYKVDNSIHILGILNDGTIHKLHENTIKAIRLACPDII